MKRHVASAQGTIQELDRKLPSFSENIERITTAMAKFLIEKNVKYGNSVNDPVRVFSKTSKSEQIDVRIDDKLSRIYRGNLSPKEQTDTIVDLVGYLIIKLHTLALEGLFDPDDLTTTKHLD